MSDMDNQGIPEPEGASDLIDTDYSIGQDNIETRLGPFELDIHNPVFLISGLAVVAFSFLISASLASMTLVRSAFSLARVSMEAWSSSVS